MKWSSNQTEIERLSRFTVAYEYSKANETLQTSASDLYKMETQQKNLTERAKELAETHAELKEKISELGEKKERVSCFMLRTFLISLGNGKWL